MRQEPQADLDLQQVALQNDATADVVSEGVTSTTTIAAPTEVIELAASMREQAVTAVTSPAPDKHPVNLSDFKEEISLEASTLFQDAAHREMFETVIGDLLMMYKKSTALDLQLGLKAIRAFITELRSFLNGCDEAEYARRAGLVAGKQEDGGRLEKYLNISSRNGYRSADHIMYNVKRDIANYLNPPQPPEIVVHVKGTPITEQQKILKQLRFEVGALRRKLEALSEASPTFVSARERLAKKEAELTQLEEKEAGQNPTKPEGPDQAVESATA